MGDMGRGGGSRPGSVTSSSGPCTTSPFPHLGSVANHEVYSWMLYTRSLEQCRRYDQLTVNVGCY